MTALGILRHGFTQRHIAVLLLGLVLVAVVMACGRTEPEPLPDIDATVEARVELATASLVAPTAVPLPTYTLYSSGCRKYERTETGDDWVGMASPKRLTISMDQGVAIGTRICRGHYPSA